MARVERVRPEQWRAYRAVRLGMLADAPRAFGSTYAEAAARTDAQWREFVEQATLWLAWTDAERGSGQAVGSVGLYADPALPPDVACLVGMWVHPDARRAGTARALVRAVVAEACSRGLSALLLDVVDEGTAARALYRSVGFVPTGRTGTQPWDDSITRAEYRLDLPACQHGAMADITVRALTEGDWEAYRSARLEALIESPEAFVATVEAEQAFPEERWRDRMNRSVRLLAEVDGEKVGIASVGQVSAENEDPTVGELFGLWVAPSARGTGVATALVRAGADTARERGRTHLAYWVGSENGRAVAFASGFGFRPTDSRRPMRVVSEDDGEEEICMILPLAGDRGAEF